ncbi:MAG: hypothetical protein IJV54_08260, partial [Bacteroidales bacterium]|nr:hypothetical protein [Bacteroidales bacterium]
MFGIPQGYVKEIARMPGDHTWAVFYMWYGDSREVEQKLSRWIDRLTPDFDIREILRRVLFLFMEHEAIRCFREREGLYNDWIDDELPILTDPYDAVSYATKYALGDSLPAPVINEAARLLDELH